MRGKIPKPGVAGVVKGFGGVLGWVGVDSGGADFGARWGWFG